jgi:prepilin-type processing-associated H-X9-DG protein
MNNRILLACLCLLALVGVGCRGKDASTPEATVKAFATAVGSGDFKTAAKWVKGGKPDANFSELTNRFKGQSFQLEAADFKTDVQGDKATATFELKMAGASGPHSSIGPETAQLERVEGVWLIVPSNDAGNISPLGHFVAMVIDPEGFFAKAQAGAKSVQCLTNVKQICLGFLMLAGDSGDVLKFKAGDWKKAISRFMPGKNVFRCPSDQSGADSYSVNIGVVGKAIKAIAKPAETVLVYEGKDEKLDFRHDGKAAVGFVDGHTAAVDAEQAKRLVWKP